MRRNRTITYRDKPGVKRCKELNWGAREGWRQSATPMTTGATVSKKSIPFVAVVSTWNDSDIIGHNIRSLLAQGCQCVEVLDNASSDNSVEVALNSGARHAEIWKSNLHDDSLRVRKQCDLAEKLVAEYGDCWVLYLDADEITPAGIDLQSFLGNQPEDVRVIGVNNFELHPLPGQELKENARIEDCYTHGVVRNGCFCSRFHWKHQIIKYSGGVYDACLTRGLHYPAHPKGIILPESKETLLMLHVPYRNQEFMRHRLSLLHDTGRDREDDDVTGGSGASSRLRQLETIYSGDYQNAQLSHPAVYGRPVTGIALYPLSKRTLIVG